MIISAEADHPQARRFEDMNPRNIAKEDGMVTHEDIMITVCSRPHLTCLGWTLWGLPLPSVIDRAEVWCCIII